MSYDNRGRGRGGYGNRGGGRSYGNRGGGYQRREMHDTECSACGAKCKVPFKPSGDRPVYCRECYMRKRDNNLTDEQMLANKTTTTEKEEEPATEEEVTEEEPATEEAETPEETVD